MEVHMMETTGGKKSELKLDKVGKILYATVKGFFQPVDANEFVEEYQKNVKLINPKDYELHFNSRELKVSSQDMVPMLSACFEMYQKDQFKNLIFDCGTNAGLKLQIRRVATSVGLNNFEIL
jgi:hypothetical protein